MRRGGEPKPLTAEERSALRARFEAGGEGVQPVFHTDLEGGGNKVMNGSKEGTSVY